MKLRQHTTVEQLGMCCAAILVGSVLVGYWNGQTPVAKSTPAPPASTLIEQIEAELAQAGCPGWMTLASEGKQALEPPAIVPANVRQTANRVPQQLPRVKYPVPLRVARRILIADAGSRTYSPISPSDDPDDLLDGMPDLLSKPETETSEKTPPAKMAPPAKQLDGDLKPLPNPESSAPAEEPQPAEDELLLEPPVATPTPKATATGDGAAREDSLPLPQKPIVEEIPASTPASSPFAPPPAPSMPVPHSLKPNHASTSAAEKKDERTYCEFIADSLYPPAEACRKCHQRNYDEWSVSSHAYAMASPMFHKFEQKINDLSQGTIGYFCYRCHSPAGVSLGISRAAPLWDLPPVAREGVTCVACHRVNERFGKVNGERRLEPGDIHAPVYGSIGGSGVAEVIANASQYKVKTSPSDQGPGQDIHVAGVYFDQLSKPEFCSSCHQVAVHPGIKLEVVWEQYRASPACKKGISCQDCHMGRIPGVPSGYEVGPAAKVNDRIVNPNRKHANHVFYGPGYSIAHPGLFPLNPKANRWSIPDWLMFDYRAGWGTDEFEDRLDESQAHFIFPPAWAEVDDRYDARDIIEENLKKLRAKNVSRIQLMENGSHVDGPYFDTPLARGKNLRFHYVVTNTNEGHNFPSGSLGAQPQLWANVVLIGPRGQRIWESGYTDRWGDVADIHSADVQNKRIPFDYQLFSLQTMFLITGAKGTDREFFLPINIDFDQLPFIRPGVQPISVINHPPFIRMEGRSIAPLGSRRAPYKIPAKLLQEPGPYRLSFRLRSRAEPIYFMRFVGATREMQRAMNEGMIDFHQSSVEFMIR